MPDELTTFSVTVTADRLAAHAPHFLEAERRHGVELLRAMYRPMMLLSIPLAPAALWFAAPERRDRPDFILTCFVCVFLAIPLVHVLHKFCLRYYPRWFDFAIRWKVRQIVEMTKRQTPFTAVYTFMPDGYRTQVLKVLIERVVEMKRIGIAFYTPSLIVCYRSDWSLKWSSVMYVDAPEQYAAIQRLLQTPGVAARELLSP